MSDRNRGITHLLERVFYPNYKYSSAIRGAPKPETPSSNPFKGRRAGFKRGSAVDSEICRYVNKGELPQSAYARKLLRALAAAGLRPTKAQVHVKDAELGLATGVDLLCAKPDGTPCIVEIKCGYNRPGAYEGSTGNMRKFLKHLTNSPHNQHIVQTVVTRALYLATFPETGRLECVIARVTDAGVHLHAVSSELHAHAAKILAAISDARGRVRVKKVKIKKKKPKKRI